MKKLQYCLGKCPFCNGQGLLGIVKEKKGYYIACDESFHEFASMEDVRAKKLRGTMTLNDNFIPLKKALKLGFKKYIYIFENGNWAKYDTDSYELNKKYIKNINYIDKDVNEVEITLNDGQVELMAYCDNYREIAPLILSTFMTSDVMISDDKTFRAINKGNYSHTIQGELYSKELGIVRVGKFFISIDKEEIPGDVFDGDFIIFNCIRLDAYSIVIK